MDARAAEAALEDAEELVPCFQATLTEAKDLRDACLDADIPVLLDRGACCGKGGCGCAPKIQVVARPEDLPRVTRLIHQRWQALALREGTIEGGHPSVGSSVPAGGGGPEGDAADTACPACGAVAPLVSGACADCGLQLE